MADLVEKVAKQLAGMMSQATSADQIIIKEAENQLQVAKNMLLRIDANSANLR